MNNQWDGDIQQFLVSTPEELSNGTRRSKSYSTTHFVKFETEIFEKKIRMQP